MFYIFGKDKDSSNQGLPPYWYTNNGTPHLGGSSLPPITSNPYGSVWPHLKKRAQNNCGVVDFTYSFIRDGTIGNNNDVMSAVSYGGQWTILKDIDPADAMIYALDRKRICADEIIVNVSGNIGSYVPCANLYTTGGEFIATCSGTGAIGTYAPRITSMDQKYGLVLIGQRANTTVGSYSGVAQLFTTGGELIQTYTGALDDQGLLHHWPGSVAILDSDHIAIGAPAFYTGVQGGKKGQVQIYHTGSPDIVKQITGHTGDLPPNVTHNPVHHYGCQIASTKSGICVTSTLDSFPYTVSANQVGGIAEFLDLSGNFVNRWTGCSYTGQAGGWPSKRYYSSIPLASNDYLYYIPGGCQNSSDCNISAFIFSSGGTEEGALLRDYGAPDWYSQGYDKLRYISMDASNEYVVQNRYFEGILRSLGTGGNFLEQNMSKPFVDAATNGDIIAGRYGQAPWQGGVPCRPLTQAGPHLSTLPCNSGMVVYNPNGIVTFDEFVAETTGAFGEWSGIFNNVFSGLSVKFTNLGLEPQTNIPSSPSAADYPLGDHIGDFRVGMQHIDHAGGIAANAWLPGGLQGISGNAGGDIHLDVQDAWRLDSVNPTNIPTSVSIKYVMAHEIGHALGIGHDSNPASLMYPTVTNSTTFSSKFPNGLSGSSPDRSAVLNLYGPITRPPWVTQCAPIGPGVSLKILVRYEFFNYLGVWDDASITIKVNSSNMGSTIERVFIQTASASTANTIKTRNAEIEDGAGTVLPVTKEPYDPGTFPFPPGQTLYRWEPPSPWPPYPTDRVYEEGGMYYLAFQFKVPHFKYDGGKIVFA